MKDFFKNKGQRYDRRACDIGPFFCRATNIPDKACSCAVVPTPDEGLAWPAQQVKMSPPPWAVRSLNRCTLSADALGSLAFALAPVPLELDGVASFHARLLAILAQEEAPQRRLQWFEAHMRAHFCLHAPEWAGFSDKARRARRKMDYVRLLRGWLFDAQGREGALLKAWVESRFGLLTHFHGQDMGSTGGEAEAAAWANTRADFEQLAARTLYGTASLEAQIDLLYAFAQSELRHRHPHSTHLTLYRGVSAKARPRVLALGPQGEEVVLLNNLSSFSSSPERADEFGDMIFKCRVPLPKILAFSGLFPSRLRGEDEYLVIGGLVPIVWVC